MVRGEHIVGRLNCMLYRFRLCQPLAQGLALIPPVVLLGVICLSNSP